LDHPSVSRDDASLRNIAGQGQSLSSAVVPKVRRPPGQDSPDQFFRGRVSPRRFCLRDHQHGVDDRKETVALLDGACRHGFILGRRFARGQRDLRHTPDPSERAFQVMGDVVSHLPDLGNQGLDAVQHLIESHRQLIDLVARSFTGTLFSRVPREMPCAVLVIASTPETARRAMNQPTPVAKPMSRAIVTRKTPGRRQ